LHDNHVNSHNHRPRFIFEASSLGAAIGCLLMHARTLSVSNHRLRNKNYVFKKTKTNTSE
jgi:hypothetical protein